LEPPDIKQNIDLKRLNTFGISVSADKYLDVNGADELSGYVKSGSISPENVFILGGGSNVLFLNSPSGIVLKMDIQGIRQISENADSVFIKAGAGVVWHDLVNYAISRNLGGIENLSLIPGSCGAAPMQNIGAYGVELEQVFEELEAVNLNTGKTDTFRSEDCDFGYRQSVFKHELKGIYAITSITLRLSKKPEFNISYGAIQETLDEMDIPENKLSVKDVSDAVIAIRRSKLPDPKETGNAGSFFKNPVVPDEVYQNILKEFPEAPGYPAGEGFTKVPAGWLIEKCGWKGKRSQNAGTWHKQALVIINYGGATGREIYDFAMEIKSSVSQRFGISLTPEVNIIE